MLDVGVKDARVFPINGVNKAVSFSSKGSWYNEPAYFIISASGEEKAYADFFGKPVKRVDVGADNIMLIYDYDLSGFVGGGKKYNIWAGYCDKCEKSREEGYKIFKDGAFFGTDFFIPKGDYKVSFKGSGFENVSPDAGFYKGGKREDIILRDIKIGENELEYKITVNNNIMHGELRLFNRGDKPSIVKGLDITPVSLIDRYESK